MSRKRFPWLLVLLALIASAGSAAQAAGKPDLLITTMSTPPKTVGPGMKLVAILGIVNYGSAGSPRSKGKLLISKDAHADSGDRVLKTFTAKALRPHGLDYHSVPVTVPSAYGSWYLIACVDVTHAVRESNEKNNCRVSPSKATIAPNPPMPVVTSVTPASPSKLLPTVHGTGPVGSYIFVYLNATCSGSPRVNTGAVGPSGTWSAPVPPPGDGTFEIHARSHSVATGESACSTTFVTFTRDTTAPPIPTGLAITGGGMGSDTTPTITGTTEAGATVKVFSSENPSSGACEGPLGSTVADSGGHFAWDEPNPLTYPGDSYRTYHLLAEDTAGNQSYCTAQLDYLLLN